MQKKLKFYTGEELHAKVAREERLASEAPLFTDGDADGDSSNNSKPGDGDSAGGDSPAGDGDADDEGRIDLAATKAAELAVRDGIDPHPLTGLVVNLWLCIQRY